MKITVITPTPQHLETVARNLQAGRRAGRAEYRRALAGILLGYGGAAALGLLIALWLVQ